MAPTVVVLVVSRAWKGCTVGLLDSESETRLALQFTAPINMVDDLERNEVSPPSRDVLEWELRLMKTACSVGPNSVRIDYVRCAKRDIFSHSIDEIPLILRVL